MSYIRLIKSKNITLEDANKIFEDEMRKKGFPSDEELKKDYEKYLNTEDAIEYAESLGHFLSFEDYKKNRLESFSNKFHPGNPDLFNGKRNFTDSFYDEWITTDDDPIEEVK